MDSDQFTGETIPVSLCPENSAIALLDIKSKVDTVKRDRRTSLSRYGKRQVLRSGSCFDSSVQTERLLLTGTLPGSSSKAFRALAEFSSYASKTLTNWITRRQPGAAWQYVWEYQKRGALHIHLVCELSIHSASYIRSHFKDEWNRILRSICRFSQVDLFAKTSRYSHPEKKTQADVTICTREPSRYLSKYIAKQGTHAKAFGRYPPKTWYQVSRSLLKRLSDRTETYEIEALSYRQSLCIIQDFESRLSNYDISGSRRFEGSILSWHGYFYHPTFNPSEWHSKLMNPKQNLISTQAMAMQIRNAVKSCPTTQGRLRTVTHHRTLDLMEKRMLSETELLMYIETGLRSLATTWKETTSTKVVAMAVSAGLQWWESKFLYTLFDLDQQGTVLRECEDFLTTGILCTKVEPVPTSPVYGIQLHFETFESSDRFKYSRF